MPNLFGYRDLDFDLDLRLHGRNQTTSVRCTIPVSLSSWLVRCHFDMMVLLANLGQACGSSDASFKASRINPTYRHCILGAQCAVDFLLAAGTTPFSIERNIASPCTTCFPHQCPRIFSTSVWLFSRLCLTADCLSRKHFK